MAARSPDLSARRCENFARPFTAEGGPRLGLDTAAPLSLAEVAPPFQMSERAIRLCASKEELLDMRTLGGRRLMYPANQIAALYFRHYPDAVSWSAVPGAVGAEMPQR